MSETDETDKKTMREASGEEDDLPPTLSAPARRALAGAGISRLDQLTAMRASDLLKLHGLGPKTIGPLREALAGRGLTFAGE